MGANSSIEWTTHTFNPWAGCQRVSPACEHCYAETQTKMYGFVEWGPAAQRRIIGEESWRKPVKWNREAHATATRARVFCASWADVFECRPEVMDARARLWRLIESTPHLDWLLLTKRPQNIGSMVPSEWHSSWPANVWLGTTVETQKYADERIPELVQHGAVVRFLSVEPQLGPINLAPYLERIDWVICGGESGGSARPTEIEWARSLRDQCLAHDVSFFFKQWGQFAQVAAGDRLVRLKNKNERHLDRRTWDQIPTPRRLLAKA